MKNIIILLSFIFFTASCGKETIEIENSSSIEIIFSSEKLASTKKVTENLCKCIDMYALIYDKNFLVAEKQIKAGFKGTLFDGLTANKEYTIIIYTENRSNGITLPSYHNTLGNARVNMTTNVDFMYFKKDIVLKSGSNKINVHMEKLFAELVFEKKNLTATVTNNYNSYSVILINSNLSHLNIGTRNFNTSDTLYINNTNNKSIINISDGKTIRDKFDKGFRYLISY